MKEDKISYWSKVLEEISVNVQRRLGESRNDPDLIKVTKIGADGTPTHKIDEIAEGALIEVLENTGRSSILISEEIGEVKIGDDEAEVLLIVDPLDGTSNAIKNLPCYGISIAVADINENTDIESLTLDDVEIAYVKNFSTDDVYTAIKGRGALKNNRPMKTSEVSEASHATLCAYIYRCPLGEIPILCSSVRRIRIMGSIAIELCYVAEGIYDSFLESQEIIRVLDIAAAQLIIKENNATITDKNLNKLNKGLNLVDKTSLIASANEELQNSIHELLE